MPWYSWLMWGSLKLLRNGWIMESRRHSNVYPYHSRAENKQDNLEANIGGAYRAWSNIKNFPSDFHAFDRNCTRDNIVVNKWSLRSSSITIGFSCSCKEFLVLGACTRNHNPAIWGSPDTPSITWAVQPQYFVLFTFFTSFHAEVSQTIFSQSIFYLLATDRKLYRVAAEIYVRNGGYKTDWLTGLTGHSIIT